MKKINWKKVIGIILIVGLVFTIVDKIQENQRKLIEYYN